MQSIREQRKNIYEKTEEDHTLTDIEGNVMSVKEFISDAQLIQ